MSKTTVISMVVLGLFLASCAPGPGSEKPDVKPFLSQLTGKWQIEGEEGYEEWTMGPDSSFSGYAYTIVNGDTVIGEHIRILEEDGGLYYEATVTGQNDDQPVRFKLISSTASELVFSNTSHDFPQEIKYQLWDDSHLKATISGIINGEQKSYEFKYLKYMKQKKVTGVGGIFFKCEDPEKMRNWYGANLGLVTNEYGSLFEFRLSDEPDRKAYLQWSPFDKNTTYFEPSQKDFMINYRVENIESLVEELKKNGVTVLDTIETYEYGKFVHILDPENNKIELWEPVDNEFTQSYEGETTK